MRGKGKFSFLIIVELWNMKSRAVASHEKWYGYPG